MKIKNLIKINVKQITKDSIIFVPLNEGIPLTDEWCRKEYEGHPNGCINYGKPLCPPNTPYLKEDILKYHYFYLIYITFNFKRYKELQKEIHPTWKDGMLGNSRHWQGQIKKIFKKYIPAKKSDSLFLACGSGIDSYYSMEAVGINVLSTYQKNKIKFEAGVKHKIENYIVMSCLICSKKANYLFLKRR